MRADARRNRSRILEAAEQVFAERGASASTEEVAEVAGVAIGTVFRHFPTKRELLSAIVKELLHRLTEEVRTLATEGDPATALFEFFTRVVTQAAAKKSVVDLLAQHGVEVAVSQPVQSLRDAIEVLLTRAQQAGAVRPDTKIDEVMALLTATSQGALHGGWPPDLRTRTLEVIFTGLRAAGMPRRRPSGR